MALKGMLRQFGARGGDASTAVPVAASAAPGSARPYTASERLALFESLEETGIGWFWATDSDNRLAYISPAAQRLFGENSVLGVPLLQLFEAAGEADGEGSGRSLSFLLNARSSFADMPVRLLRDGPQDAWWAITGKQLLDAKGNFAGFRGSAKDISATFERQRQSSHLAQYDALTGLANRHRMKERLTGLLHSLRPANRPCGLMMIDLDRFKQVNDLLGHPAGDDLLRQVAQRLTPIMPPNAEVGRLGGDEFQIILPDIDDRGRLGELAQKIIQMLSQPFLLEGRRASIGASVGIAISPFDGDEPEDLTKSADLALYAAKAGGRGQYRFFSRELRDSAEDQAELEAELRDALSAGQLQLHYQPVVDGKTHLVRSFEGLLRWEHPVRGSISPATLVRVAEGSPLIDELCRWSLIQACRDALEWPEELGVSVNISARQLLSPDFCDVVEDALLQTGLAAARLELEISERVFQGDVYAAEDMLAHLRKLGVKLALDGFGAGHFPLGHLREAPFDRIKIGQGLVSGCIADEGGSAAVLSAIIHLARGLSMQSTLTGIEAMDELAAIAKLGADMLQGYVFAEPAPQADVLARLAAGDLRYVPSGPKQFRSERRSVLRRVGVIHGDTHYISLMRNLSRTGAMIEGLLNVPVGTELVLDLGEGQLVVATVRRSRDSVQGLEFESPLINDGADGLVTRHRVSPYLLAANGLPHGTRSATGGATAGDPGKARFMQVDVLGGINR